MYNKFQRFSAKHYSMGRLYLSRIFTEIYVQENYCINDFFDYYFPIFDLFIVVTLCLLFNPRNLFILLRFYRRLVLFSTPGIDYGHENRKRRPSQIQALSTMI
jgi:hypothetical protein